MEDFRKNKKPRETFFVGVVSQGPSQEMIFERVVIDCSDLKNTTEEDLFELAIIKFKEDHGIEPEFLDGPFRFFKGTAKPKNIENVRHPTIQVDIDKVDYSKELCEAEYNNWKVSGRYIANPKECISDYDLKFGKVVFVRFKNFLQASNKKKSVPNPKFILESDLQNIQKTL